MDSTAIKEIQKPYLIEKVQAAIDSSNTSVPLVVTTSGIENLDAYMPSLSRMRLEMSTDSLEAFTDYVEDHDTGTGACFVDGDNMTATTVFDFGTVDEPLHRDHKSRIKLSELSDYACLLRVVQSRRSQKELAEFIEDYADNITVLDAAGVEIATGLAVAAIRTMTIEARSTSTHEDGDMRSSRSTMDEIEAQGKDVTPAVLRFKCRPYSCIAERDFDIRLSILTGDTKPNFNLRVKQYEKHIEEITHEFTELVKVKLENTQINVYLGTI